MTITISMLLPLLLSAEQEADTDDAGDWRGLRAALETYRDIPLSVLTTKLSKIVLKTPATKTPRSTSRAVGRKASITASQRTEALNFHSRALTSAFNDDAIFAAAFDAAKADSTLDAKTALALFEQVIGPTNFPTTPLRKPTIFKQIRDQRNTIVYRRQRTGQLDE